MDLKKRHFTFTTEEKSYAVLVEVGARKRYQCHSCEGPQGSARSVWHKFHQPPTCTFQHMNRSFVCFCAECEGRLKALKWSNRLSKVLSLLLLVHALCLLHNVLYSPSLVLVSMSGYTHYTSVAYIANTQQLKMKQWKMDHISREFFLKCCEAFLQVHLIKYVTALDQSVNKLHGCGVIRDHVSIF